MHRAPRFYYGWIIVAIAGLTMMVVIGIFFTSGVLFAAIVTGVRLEAARQPRCPSPSA